LEAEITLEYNDAMTTEAVAKAISPDNFRTPSGLFIKTTKKGDKVITKIRCKGKLATFIATIDDLLFCVSTAEKTLKATKLLNRKD
jgi:hypothetical protein